MQRSPELVAALLAVLRLGAAYVPLDPNYPAARNRFIIEDCSAGLLLVDNSTEGASTKSLESMNP